MRRQLLVLLSASPALVLLEARPAFADNCGGLADCSFGVKIALVAAGIALVLLAILLLPELIAGAAVEAEAEAAAAEAAAAEAAASRLGEAELAEAFEYANTDSKLAHVFDNAEHGLDFLVESSGGQSQAMRQLVNSLADGIGLPEAGRFEVVRVIDGVAVTIRGAVVDGIPKIGTAFVP